MSRHGQQVKREPTPAEIRLACSRIQNTWSNHEREKRRCLVTETGWMPPLVNLRVVEHSISEQSAA